MGVFIKDLFLRYPKPPLPKKPRSGDVRLIPAWRAENHG